MKTLAQLEITNGEAAELAILTGFLSWMRQESTPVPVTRRELNVLLAKWVAFDRREKMRVISEQRVAKGLTPLPPWLTRPCATCGGDGRLMSSTGDPKHPLRGVPCPKCA